VICAVIQNGRRQTDNASFDQSLPINYMST
jgi:hypothetical protein